MFCEKLKQRREEFSLTQEKLSECISSELNRNEELSRQTVSKWERNGSYPDVEKLLVLSVILDISLDDLFAEELSYLRKEKAQRNEMSERYPGMIAGLKAFAEALKRQKFSEGGNHHEG